MFKGEKVCLRPIELEDLPLLAKWRNDGELAKYIWPGVQSPVPLVKQREWYDKLLKSGEKAFMICAQAGGAALGMIGIHDISAKNQLGYLSMWLGETDYWGHGYGSEALVLFLGYCFRIMNMRRIILEVYDYNERAIRAYEKIGFAKEGKVRRSVFKDGKYIDEYIMAMFKEDYYARYPFKSWGEEYTK